MKAGGDFLSAAERTERVRIARDRLEEHRIARRANAILLLDDTMSSEQVATVLVVDGSTVRAWRKAFDEGGVEAIVMFDLKGGSSPLSPLQLHEPRAWATEVLPASTTEIGRFILDRFGLDYGRSGRIELMNRIGFDWKKPEAAPGEVDAEAQRKLVAAHEDMRNALGPDEAVAYVDAVHPTHQTRFAGRWQPRGQRCAIATSSGRDRLNLHGATDLETGATRIVEVEKVDAQSPIRLLESIERTCPAMTKSHVPLDNARYHHAKRVREGLDQPGRKIVLRCIAPCCPHLNPIERLWQAMHKPVTHDKTHAEFRDFADAVLDFLRETAPRRLDEFSSIITDNFPVVEPKDFRILA